MILLLLPLYSLQETKAIVSRPQTCSVKMLADLFSSTEAGSQSLCQSVSTLLGGRQWTISIYDKHNRLRNILSQESCKTEAKATANTRRVNTRAFLEVESRFGFPDPCLITRRETKQAWFYSFSSLPVRFGADIIVKIDKKNGSLECTRGNR